nr:pre-mRNA-processing factor 39 isoform X2 [Ipomoea batatas]
MFYFTLLVGKSMLVESPVLGHIFDIKFKSENFKDLVSILEEEIRSLNNGNLEVQAEELYNGTSALSDKEISQVVNDLWDPFPFDTKFLGTLPFSNLGKKGIERIGEASRYSSLKAGEGAFKREGTCKRLSQFYLQNPKTVTRTTQNWKLHIRLRAEINLCF